MITKTIEIKVNQQGTQEAKQKMDGLNQSTISNTQANKQNEEAQKSLKLQYREAILELQKLSEQYGLNSKQAVEAAKRAADLRDRIEDANDAMLAFKGEGTFIATSKALSSVTSGLGAVEGAMNLLGNESEDVQKALLRVQSAMALSQGLEGLEDAGRSFNQLKIAIANIGIVQKANNLINKTATSIQLAFTGAVNTTSISFKALRGAIIATGIGALVVGVGALIQNFDKIKAVILNVVPGLKAVGETITGIVNGITDFIGVTNKVDRELDKQKAYAEKALKQNEKYLKANEHKLSEARKREIELQNEHWERVASGEFTRERSLQILREKSNQERQKAIDEANAIEIEKQRELAEKQKELRDEAIQKQREKLAEEQRLKEEAAQREIEAEKERLDAIENIRLEYAKKIEDLEAETELEKIALEEKRAIEELDRLNATKEQKLELEKYYARLRNEELEKIQQEEFEKQLAKATEEADNEQLSFEERLAVLQEREFLIQDMFKGTEEEKLKLLKENQDKIDDVKKKSEDDEKKREEALANFKQNLVNDTFSLLGGLAKQGSKLGKAVAISQATISTFQGVNKALAETTDFTPSQSLRFLNAAIVGASGLANISKIVSTPEISTGGGASAGSSQVPTAPSFNLIQGTGTNQIAESLATQKQPIKTYVVSSEVTTQQALDRNIQANASI